MARITTFIGPPSHLLIFFELVSESKKAAPSGGALRAKKGKKKTKKIPKPESDEKAFRALAEILAVDDGLTPGAPDFGAFVFARMDEFSRGIVNPAYFRLCKVHTAQTLESIPTSVADPAPPPYGYRTESFMPSIPTYPDGAVTTSPVGYSGAKSGGLFVDQFLRWRKIRFNSKINSKPDQAKRALYQHVAVISVAASSRGCRPAFSYNLVAHHLKSGSPALLSTKPPLSKVSGLYWRFHPPIGGPPYYAATLARDILKPFSSISTDDGTGSNIGYLVNIANRPMMGRAYNNNDYVTSTFDQDPKIWEQKVCSTDLVDRWERILSPSGMKSFSPVYSTERDEFFGTSYVDAIPKKTWTRDLVNWRFEEIPTGWDLRWITWSSVLSRYIGTLYESGKHWLVTSPDGEDVTRWPYPHNDRHTSIVYSPELEIFVATVETTVHSPFQFSYDGYTWFESSFIEHAFFGQVVWSPARSLFVAIGNFSGYARIATSPDGINWSSFNAPVNYIWIGLAWSPLRNLFVAVANESFANAVMTSPDGLTWTLRYSPAGTLWAGVKWIQQTSQFIAWGATTGSSAVMTSPDGLTWTMKPTPAGFGASKLAFGSKHCLLFATSTFDYDTTMIWATGSDT